MSELLQPKLTNMQLCSNLFEMVVNDLLGPACGPEGGITERNVHDRLWEMKQKMLSDLTPARRSV